MKVAAILILTRIGYSLPRRGTQNPALAAPLLFGLLRHFVYFCYNITTSLTALLPIESTGCFVSLSELGVPLFNDRFVCDV